MAKRPTTDAERVAIAQDYLRAAEGAYVAILASRGTQPWPERSSFDDERVSPRALALKAVEQALGVGLQPPNWAIVEFLSSLDDFKQFKFATLGAAFGVSDHKHLTAKRHHLLRAAIASEIAHLSASLSLTDTAQQEGAYTLAGRKFGISGKQAEKLRAQWLKERSCDGDDASYPDAAPAIFRAIADALQPQTKTENSSPPSPTKPPKKARRK